MDNDNLKLYGVEGYENGLTIALNNSVRSLVFQKDAMGRVYIDGVPGIRVASFKYKEVKTTVKDNKGEAWNETGSVNVINPATYAYYHVNPANADVNDLKDLVYSIEKNAEYKSTRALASNNFSVKAEFDSFVNGILKVKVSVTGTAATDDNISVVALQAKKNNGEVVTSDYATIYNYEMDALRFVNNEQEVIVNSKKHKAHLRRLVINSDAKYNKDYMTPETKDAYVWDGEDSDNDGSFDDIDIELQYDKEKDLKNIVAVHVFDALTPECTNSVADIDALNLTLKYEVVQNYKLGTNNTDQKDFIDLNGSVIKAKVFGTSGIAAIGRTPIIRVSLLSGSKVVEVAYLKVKIVGQEPIKLPEVIELNMGNHNFNCADWVKTTTVEDINVQLYNVLQQLGVSREKFYTEYAVDVTTLAENTSSIAQDINAQNRIGTVTNLADVDETGTTHLIKWTVSEDRLWQKSGQDIYHDILYKNNAGGGDLTVRLKGHVNTIAKVYDVVEAKYISEYWNSTKSIANFNVNVPTSTSDNDPDNCLFENDLNSPFITYPVGNPNAGIIDVDSKVTKIIYKFHSSNENSHTFGNVTRTFNVTPDGLQLRVGTEVIARIINAPYITKGQNTVQNVVLLNKNSNTAKELLNTEAFTMNIMATGYVCSSTDKDVKITFKGNDSFTVQYVKPIIVTSQCMTTIGDSMVRSMSSSIRVMPRLC